jgi:hypothetical protein
MDRFSRPFTTHAIPGRDAARAGKAGNEMVKDVCWFVLFCAVLSAQDKPATPVGTLPGKLDAFAPLIGRDWTAPLPNGNLTDTQRFEWKYGRKFIRNTHEVKTAKGEVVYEGETIYAWDARSDRIVWWYWNASGGYLEGTASVSVDGAISTEGQNHGGGSQLDRTRSTIRITADAWTFAPSFEKDGVWKSEPMRTYR